MIFFIIIFTFYCYSYYFIIFINFYYKNFRKSKFWSIQICVSITIEILWFQKTRGCLVSHQENSLKILIFNSDLLSESEFEFDHRVLFKRLVQLLGVVFTQRAVDEFSSSLLAFDRPNPLDHSDLLEITERVKKMDIVNHADGLCFFFF